MYACHWYFTYLSLYMCVYIYIYFDIYIYTLKYVYAELHKYIHMSILLYDYLFICIHISQNAPLFFCCPYPLCVKHEEKQLEMAQAIQMVAGHCLLRNGSLNIS